MNTYNYRITTDTATTNTATLLVSAGIRSFQFNFVWDTVNQEQYDILDKGLKDRALADPLLDGSDIIRDYDWIDWYLALPLDIESYLINGGAYPQSLRNTDTAVRANLMNESRDEAKVLSRIRNIYKDQLVWNVVITELTTSKVLTGVVRPGGWINNQSDIWRVRFVSALTEIGKEDLNKVFIEFEVDE